MKTPVSVTILTRNSEKTLKECLQSVSFCDDIIVLDGNSTDRTREIAREYGARVYPQYEGAEENIKIKSFTQMRVKSFALAKYDWVFYIDSDEYLSEKLQDEIKRVVEENNTEIVGMFNRNAIVDGTHIKHAYFYPDWCARLINKKSGVHWKPGAVVHESFVYPEGISKRKLKGILHSYWPSFEDSKKKDNYYLGLSEKRFKEKVSTVKWRYFLQGAVLNTARAFYIFLKIIWQTIRYRGKGVLPFRFHMRFVRYHLRMAWSGDKWRAMITKKIPRALLCILFLGLIIRLVMFGVLIGQHGQDIFVYGPNGDAVEYVKIAENLANYGKFSLSDPLVAKTDGWLPNDFRAPGYPLLLIKLLGAKGFYWPTIIFQILLSVGLIGLVYSLSKELFGNKAGIIAAGFAAFEPNMVYWPNQLITESVFTFLFTLSIYLFVRWIKDESKNIFLWSIAILAIATHVRQVSYPLLLLLSLSAAIIWYLKKKRVMCGAWAGSLRLFVLGVGISFLILSPWFVRNHIVLQQFSYSPSFAARGSVGKYLEGYTQMKFNKTPGQVYEEIGSASGSEAGALLAMRAIKTFFQDPLPFFVIGASSAVPFFLSDGWFTIAKTLNPEFSIASFDKSWDGNPRTLPIFISQYIENGGSVFVGAKIIYLVISLAFLYGLICAYRNHRDKRYEIALLAFLVLYILFASGIGSYARFRYPIEPVIFVFAAYAFSLVNFDRYINKQ